MNLGDTNSVHSSKKGYDSVLWLFLLLRTALPSFWFYREAWLLGAVTLSTYSTETLTCPLSESP